MRSIPSTKFWVLILLTAGSSMLSAGTCNDRPQLIDDRSVADIWGVEKRRAIFIIRMLGEYEGEALRREREHQDGGRKLVRALATAVGFTEEHAAALLKLSGLAKAELDALNAEVIAVGKSKPGDLTTAEIAAFEQRIIRVLVARGNLMQCAIGKESWLLFRAYAAKNSRSSL